MSRGSPRRVSVTLLFALLLALSSVTAVFAGSQKGSQGNNSEAEITVVFEPDCSGFHVESSKEISFVSTNTEDPPDFSYHKFEGNDIESEDQDFDRDDPDGSDRHDFSYSQDDPYKSIVVKSGRTMLVFNCPEGGGPVGADPNEKPECSDGVDNDGDGKTDHPEDDGCETPDDDDERPAGDDGGGDTEGPQGDPSCEDGVDNDNDGLTDQEDPDCNEGANDGEFCDDGLDNDGDGKTDAEDEDCPQDGTEGPQGDPSCEDGVDNDNDGLTDQEDPDCNEGAQDGAFCDDGVDNDGDGLTDADDPDCQEDGTEGPQGDPSCEDGVDNDNDGLTDQEDPDCNEGAQDGAFCDDGIDNDGDGLTDGDDPDCPQPDPCTAEAGDPGILTENTLGQTIWDNGADALSPLTEDPNANGIVSGAVYEGGNGSPLEPLTDEAACALDLLIDEGASPIDP